MTLLFEYCPGKTNVVADALSRIEEASQIVAITIITTDLKKQIKEVYNSTYQEIYKFLQNPSEDSRLQELAKRITLKEELLYYDETRIIIPGIPKICLQIMQEYYDTPFAGHYGYAKTLANIT